MTRCLNLLVAMTVSAEPAKHLMMKERMEVLTELQVEDGLGFLLQVLQLLWMKVSAATTLERLWLCLRRLITRSEDGLAGRAVMRFMDLEGISSKGRDAQFLTFQDDLG